jgi:hypothetical protein
LKKNEIVRSHLPTIYPCCVLLRWTGYDCKTPVCESVADGYIRWQLNTVDEEKVHTFESDPCGEFSPIG